MINLLDQQVRLAAFKWLFEQVTIYGQVLPRTLLSEGFLFEGYRIPLVSPQGIFKPKILDMPLTITTAPDDPYEDSFMKEKGFLFYKYRGTDPNHRDNVGLRNAMKNSIPLIYLHGIAKGKYFPVWPVYIKGDDPINLTFAVIADDYQMVNFENKIYLLGNVNEGRRDYITTEVKRRLHQSAFREKVISAYKEQCAICRLKHPELLDAAHIIPDSEPEGKPIVTNGISLCKLHHAAFDKFFLGIRPDYIIEVRKDIMSESDGPMLQHGLKGINKSKILLPRNSLSWPDKNHLKTKYDLFESAG